MPKQTSRSSARNQGNEALQSLLNDQAEARLQKEINISRSEQEENPDQTVEGQSSGSSAEKKSKAASQAGVPPARPVSGIKKPPSIRETKAQLIERMKKLIGEMDKLEAILEQKDLEKEKAEKDKERLISELEGYRNEKTSLDLKRDQNKEILEASLARQQEMEKNILLLERKNLDFLNEVQEKEQIITDLKHENQALKSNVQEMDVRIKELSSSEAESMVRLNEKDNENYLLSQELEKIQEDKKKMEKQVPGSENEVQVPQKQTKAIDWRTKASSLWDGTGYTAPQKALSYLNAALEIRPDWPEALNDRGLAYLDDYQLDKSIEDFTAAIALKGEFAEAFHNRGVALLKSGKKYAAKKDFQAAAGLGLWLGMNALSAPSKGPGIINSIKKMLGISGRD
jgi:hypothetical protein